MRTKVLLPIFGLLIVGYPVLTGCKKSSNGSSAPSSMTATLSGAGASFQIKSISASESESQGNFTIVGIEPNGSADSVIFEVSFTDSTVLNTSTAISSSINNGFYFTDLANTDSSYVAYQSVGHGTILLTSWDHVKLQIAGTFSGVMYNSTLTDSIVVSNGTFNTPYSIEP